MIDLDSVRRRAAQRAGSANVANAANLLMQGRPISKVATVAMVATLPQTSSAKPTRIGSALIDAINRACDARGDDAANRAALIAECLGLTIEQQADMLAHFALEAARYTGAAR